MNIPARSWVAALAVSVALWLLLAWIAAATAQPQRYRGAARVVVQFETPANVEHLCGLIGAPRSIACANDRVIIAPNPCLHRGYYAELMCHEIAHVNGWQHS